MRLRQLTGLEREKLEQEYKDLMEKSYSARSRRRPKVLELLKKSLRCPKKYADAGARL